MYARGLAPLVMVLLLLPLLAAVTVRVVMRRILHERPLNLPGRAFCRTVTRQRPGQSLVLTSATA